MVILALAGTFYFVNNQRKNKNRRAVDVKASAKAAETKKEQKSKKARKDGGQSSGDQAVKTPQKSQKKKSQLQGKPAVEDRAVTTALESKDTDGEDNDNREFARAMANAKQGTLATPKSQAASRPKSVKQTRAQDKPVVEASSDNATAPSSTTGGDADDDQSPMNSPDLGATEAGPIASGDVSDMLEKTSAGPSVLRVTESTKQSTPKKQKSQTSFEVAETKKQRQNRKKAEEKKAAREAEEKERQVLLEKQRRTAREAEGRAAKDGSAFMASQAPSKSAWTAPPEVNGSNGSNGAPAKPVELLDTYEPNGEVTTKAVEKVYSESEESGSKLAKDYAHMTEEEQIRFAVEDSAAWQTVKGKEKRKKKNGGKDSNGSKDSASEKGDYGVPPVSEPTAPGKQWTMNKVFVKDDNVEERNEDVQDSEWEVA